MILELRVVLFQVFCKRIDSPVVRALSRGTLTGIQAVWDLPASLERARKEQESMEP